MTCSAHISRLIHAGWASRGQRLSRRSEGGAGSRRSCQDLTVYQDVDDRPGERPYALDITRARTSSWKPNVAAADHTKMIAALKADPSMVPGKNDLDCRMTCERRVRHEGRHHQHAVLPPVRPA